MRLDPDKKLAGVLAPVFALRHEGDLGVGDTLALRHLIDWAAEHGLGVVQVLPINEAGSDNSPYNAVSSTALDPVLLHLSPETVPGLSRKALDKALEEHPGDPDVVRYDQVRPVKLKLLEKAWKSFRKQDHPLREQYEEFCQKEAAWLEPYLLFRILMEANGTEYWLHWKEEQRGLAGAREWMEGLSDGKRKKFERRMEFFRFVQWVAYWQWREVKLHAEERRVALMGDVPMGINYYSADVFSEPEEFELDWSGGAPPEPYFKDDRFTQVWGQNWGIPLYRWEFMRENNFRWWRRRVHLVRDIFHLFRVDHVLGFYRLYAFPWRPEENHDFLDLTPAEAQAKTGGRLPGFQPRSDENPGDAERNRSEGEGYLRVLIEEAGPHRLIGEDLGMVPDYVRPSLASLEIAGFKIPMWEGGTHGEGLRGEEYPRLSLVTYGTHDHEPLRSLWNRWSTLLQDERQGQAGAADEIRADLHQLSVFTGVGEEEWAAGFDPSVHEKLIRALMESNSWLAISMVTDLFGTEQRFNVPGAVADSNWSQRIPTPVREWGSMEKTQPVLSQLREMSASTGRLP